ncbi:MAG: penicillin-binding protein 2 [Firmicutes bacterium]|nr:penicillin-binding protein 2 [Bacillota bacterium]
MNPLWRCRKRIFCFLLLLCCCLILLGARLFLLQVIRGPQLSAGAVRQREHSLVILDGRGDIQDRNGVSLLGGKREIGLVAFPAHYRGYEAEIVARLHFIKGIEAINNPPYGSAPFWIAPSLQEMIDPAAETLPGLLPVPRVTRYGSGSLASHLVGYVQEHNGRGVSGIELAFDDQLSQGMDTVLAAPVDNRGRLIAGLGYRIRRASSPGCNVVLTLERKLQAAVEAIMDRYIARGAVVVMDPHSGDILAGASRPDFDPGDIGAALQKEDGALVNRLVSAYQPGSVFKTIVAAAALEEGRVNLFDRFSCPGGITVAGDLYIPCSFLHGREQITLVEAFAHSCNSAFIELALDLGPELLYKYAAAFGCGAVTGLPIGESAGNMPLPSEITGSKDLANTAIGQGKVLTSPLQVTVIMAAIANGGRRVEPRLVKAITDAQGREIRSYLPRRGKEILSPATINKLKYLLQAVVEQGTGRSANIAGAVAGMKTGTAESGREETSGKPIFNYWAAGFYPLESTRAVIVVFADQMKDGTVTRVFGEITRALDSR